MTDLLVGKEVTKIFGGVKALDGVDFVAREKEMLGLIGPNGAGKTTLFNVINGFYPPEKGEIVLDGLDITGLRPHRICNLGIARTYQIVQPFSSMSALQNVQIGVLFGRARISNMGQAKKKAVDWLRFVGLENQKSALAENLGLLSRKRLEIARALSSEPRVILLDEVIAGLNPKETEEALGLIRGISRELGISVLWVEHVMKAVMALSDRLIVLNYGKKIAEGTPRDIATNRDVIEAYLGKSYA